ncbi:hypothetical protein D3C71_1914910 [compost metagenome]
MDLNSCPSRADGRPEQRADARGGGGRQGWLTLLSNRLESCGMRSIVLAGQRETAVVEQLRRFGNVVGEVGLSTQDGA